MNCPKEYLKPDSEIFALEGNRYLLEGSSEGENKKVLIDLIQDPEISL